MQLQTQLNVPQQQPQIDYTSRVLLLGSCFAENIGEKFAYYQFQQLQNPLGILFHPFAIENFLKRVANQEKFTAKAIFQHQEIYSCFEAHSRLNALSENELLNDLNTALEETFHFLKTTSHVIITLGTSWIYKHIEQNKYVANCHKIPQKNFNKELSSVTELEKSLQKSVAYIQEINADSQFVFTISPVRHLKDGFIENQRSKSHLIAALHQVLENKKRLAYFPSYEIMMDELRDYRFYTSDLLHPNNTAIDYIWERFQASWMAEECLPTMKKVQQIRQGLSHRPFNPKSESHQKFQQKLQQQTKEIQQSFPFMEF
ncbi:GSCFA domain-containing protein [Mesonia aestuariivivens]|uniref:GSCFA domain-containing protein n=1 Tax=Mesonia aestuariivivens TaxID=2796128 RepID=A0ABS6W3D6_9FLAO|nr:GSCFA domain-containing protein [Mesonia aestuariivivens]MBW2962371.1 GSCFA domain-containing protein [Mesonia aestuariivivens]